MAKQTINIGSVANDGSGDPLRVAFDKTNDNFDELYSLSVAGPSTTTLNALVRWGDITGSSLLNSTVIADGAGNLTVPGTVNTRDIATDGAKLDTIDANADQTTSAAVISALSGASLTAVTVDAADLVLIQDVTDSNNLKTVTAASLAALTSGLGNFDFETTVASGIDAVGDVNDGLDQITVTGHPFAEDDEVLYQNGGGTDISGLTHNDPYFVIYVDANTIQLESTLGGGAINIAAGVGTDHRLSKVAESVMTTSTTDTDIVLQPSGVGQVVINDTKAIRLPAGTTAERPTVPSTGDFRYNSTTSYPEYYDGSGWVTIYNGNVAGGTSDIFTGNDVLVNFTLSSAQTTESVIVTINGVLQVPGISYAYTVSGTTLTFTEAPPTGAIIEARSLT